ncbi:hypothetical protein [Sphingobium sp. EM0848]|uniref:hypothetical protein n=1 Tax=Sphingobium sp. EM0848 TaxID=2743473 RepID=UPI0021017820|nr:hypothetical protein [Sphingobium sp. EM0848]
MTVVGNVVRRAVRDIPGIEVVPDEVLGTFSFAKYLMWKDLVDRANLLKQSPVVRHLIDRDGGATRTGDAFPKPKVLDGRINPVDLFTPLPADSSQLAAVVASANGHNFLLPGVNSPASQIGGSGASPSSLAHDPTRGHSR